MAVFHQKLLEILVILLTAKSCFTQKFAFSQENLQNPGSFSAFLGKYAETGTVEAKFELPIVKEVVNPGKEISLHRFVVCFIYCVDSIVMAAICFQALPFIFVIKCDFIAMLIIIRSPSPSGSPSPSRSNCVWSNCVWSPCVGHLVWVTLCGSPCVGHLEWVTLCGSNYMGHLVCDTL